MFYAEEFLDPTEPPRDGIPVGSSSSSVASSIGIMSPGSSGPPPSIPNRPSSGAQRQQKLDRLKQQYAAKRQASMGFMVHASESPKRPVFMDSDDSDDDHRAEESAPIAALTNAQEDVPEHVQPVVMEVGRVTYGAAKKQDQQQSNGQSPNGAPLTPSSSNDGLNQQQPSPDDSVRRSRFKSDDADTASYSGSQRRETDKENSGLTDAERILQERGLSASYDPTKEAGHKPNPTAPPPFVLDLTDKRSFLMKPAPKGGVIQCKIVRDRSGMEKLYPRYMMYLEKQDVFFLSARKRKKSKTSNYLLSLDMEDMARDSGNYLGKLRSNVMGTEFTIFDKGDNPEKTRLGASSPVGIRQELGVVKYETNVFGLKGPRKMICLIPKVSEDGVRTQWKPTSDRNSMTACYGRKEMNDMMVLTNKTPTWNDETSSYVLNFRGRVTVASVKNFQLIDMNQTDSPIYMQFGRIGTDEFTLDYQFPLSALQAFAIALSSFDGKLACE